MASLPPSKKRKKCNPCVRYDLSPMCRVAQPLNSETGLIRLSGTAVARCAAPAEPRRQVVSGAKREYELLSWRKRFAATEKMERLTPYRPLVRGRQPAHGHAPYVSS